MFLPVEKTSIVKFDDLFTPEQIDMVIISHYHPDHICGLKKFVNAEFIAWDLPKKGLFTGFIPSLLPNDFYQKVKIVCTQNNNVYMHNKLNLPTFNIFNDDDNLAMILLKGHSNCHCGLLIANKIFMISDAVWTRSSYRELKYPSYITNLVQENVTEYYQTIKQLHQIDTSGQYDILPSHCPEITSFLNKKKYIQYTYIKPSIQQSIKNTNILTNVFTILITGVTGFVGKNLVKYLLKMHSNNQICSNLKIIGCGRSSIAPDELLSYKFAKQNIFSYYSFDLKDQMKTKNLVNSIKPTCVIHCAAHCKEWDEWKNYYDINVLATKNLLNCCLENSVKKFIFVSSSSVYTNNYDLFNNLFNNSLDNLNETHMLTNKYKSYYALSKLMAEHEVRKILPNNQMETIILRPRGIYGKDDKLLLPKLLKSLNYIPNFGNVYASLTHVDNICHAIFLGIINDKARGIYNISDDKVYNITNLIANLKNIKKIPNEDSKLIDDKYMNQIEVNSNNLTNNKIDNKHIHIILLKFAMFLIALIVEIFFYILLFFNIKYDPIMTRYTLSLISNNYILNIDKAKKELNYHPISDKSLSDELKNHFKKPYTSYTI